MIVISGMDIGAGGFALWPSMNDIKQGVFLDTTDFTDVVSNQKDLAHEVGHWLGSYIR